MALHTVVHAPQLSTGGMMSRGTAMPISVMLSSSIPMSILATHPDWSSLLSLTGTLATSDSVINKVSK